jgi:LuxR family maltose regulon positive regulatory protein
MTGSSGTTTLPHLPPSFVSRPRLLALLDDRAVHGLVVVKAPAGFGKTALLADWARRGGSATWLRPLAGGSGLPAQVASALAVSPPPERLIVDDVDDLDAITLRNVLDVVRRHPHGARCVLAGRRIDVEGAGVSSVHAEHLAFTREETAAFLTARGVALDAEQVRRLHRRTGGSPAGLQLAALSLRRGAGPAHLLAVLGDVDRWPVPPKDGERALDRALVRMLPSDCSVAQIADELRVPVPVARRRMHAAYSALGTSSRRGAVLAARERGLFR